MRPLQARDGSATRSAYASESKRKLMEELLTLKSEVTQLRKAAELSEETQDQYDSKGTVLKQLREQILSLRDNQNKLQKKYDA